MFRAIGFALLFLGLSGPTLAILCNVQCHFMQSASTAPAHTSLSLEEALPPCCGNQQVMVRQLSVKPQAQFRRVSQPQRHKGNDLSVVDSVSYTSLVPLQRLAFLSSSLSSAVLRI